VPSPSHVTASSYRLRAGASESSRPGGGGAGAEPAAASVPPSGVRQHRSEAQSDNFGDSKIERLAFAPDRGRGAAAFKFNSESVVVPSPPRPGG
jgi:hypothetical protein